MPMTPAVAGARRRHKAMEAAKATVGGAILLVVCGAFLWGAISTMRNTWMEYRADNEFRSVLVAASEKSPAHHFLVTNWLQCTPLLQTRAGCYSSIRGAAASRGEAFIRQVDEAARELDLI